MANFKNAFDQGLKAAADAAAVIAEINSVFDEVNTEISAASDGKVNIRRETRSDRTSMAALLGLGLFSSKQPEPEIKYITYIVAINPLAESSNKADIGQVDIDKRGYPCEIKFGGDKYLCEDKKGLERVLSLMLSDPEVGKQLSKLIRLPVASIQDPE
ncbi:hypothetical protein SAMN04490186_5696 [Pseudomonas grimontii]|uniref:Uncharacterized protein n=1 Tax=Pseudomonas grimontii TaxID=129847 RepID=A0A1H1IHD8_9PSED|nr:hypothetical protein [Pseudomonas grimontii]TWR64260.1 hypothetical protein FIV39_18905 [Pseudomonas grimontii]SDR36969.1 hypothetical protein SAMN04490186_5696 [Pseudomonas grimontii]